MISISEALAHVLAHARPLPPERAALREALGAVLAEDVASDVDSPPHDKSLVDGYTVRSTDIARVRDGRADGPVELAVLEEVAAGELPSCTVTSGHATRIMTGAPIPDGADAVVMVEDTIWNEEAGTPLGVVRIDDMNVSPGQHIMRRGATLRRGQVVLTAGAEIRPIEIGLLAEVGRTDAQIVPRPHVAILPTGNELIPPEFSPGPGKIRNSNGPMLAALVRNSGGLPIDAGLGRDDREQLSARVQQGLQADVLVLSGGVSAGKLDLVPEVLASLGVESVFHKIRLKPGKPLWFGIQQSGGGDTLVFGLPGNPVSSLVCFHLFVAPALARLAGRDPKGPPKFQAALTDRFSHHGDRPTYHPARTTEGPPTPSVELISWQGSGDLCALAEADSLAIFPAGEKHYHAGELLECVKI